MFVVYQVNQVSDHTPLADFVVVLVHRVLIITQILLPRRWGRQSKCLNAMLVEMSPEIFMVTICVVFEKNDRVYVISSNIKRLECRMVDPMPPSLGSPIRVTGSLKGRYRSA